MWTDRPGRGRNQPRRQRQDAVDLFLLHELRLAPAVVQVHDREGFDEQSCAAARLVVDQAGMRPLNSARRGIT